MENEDFGELLWRIFVTESHRKNKTRNKKIRNRKISGTPKDAFFWHSSVIRTFRIYSNPVLSGSIPYRYLVMSINTFPVRSFLRILSC